MINLHNYLSEAIERIVNNALNSARANIRELLYLRRFRNFSDKAVLIRDEYASKGDNIPPFLIMSITSSCNLFCAGCYARANNTCGTGIKDNQIKVNRYKELFREAEQLGVSFILLAGGEPLIRKDVLVEAAKHKKIMFPIFTNGTLIDTEYVRLFNRNRNLLPVVSLEGDLMTTDMRRGKGVYNKILKAFDQFKDKNIFFGCSITVDKNNLNEVTDAEFINMLYKYGCKVVFFIEYVPMDEGTINIVPNHEDREVLDRRIRELGEEYKYMIFLSFPGDEKYLEGCLAAGRGFFHVSVNGDAEPCPFSPYSDTNVKEKSLLEALSSPLFKGLRDSGLLKEEHIGGCLLHQKEAEVKAMLNSSESNKD